MADGCIYVGPRFMEKPNGFGRCTYPNGDIYVGEWKDGFMHGAMLCILAI